MNIFFLDFDFTFEFLPVILLIVNYLCHFVYGYKLSCKIMDMWMLGGTIAKVSSQKNIEKQRGMIVHILLRLHDYYTYIKETNP